MILLDEHMQACVCDLVVKGMRGLEKIRVPRV